MNFFICPATGGELELVIEDEQQGTINQGYYQNAKGAKYPIKDGIPNFIYPQELSEQQKKQHQYYESNAEIYDELQGLTFALHNQDEDQIRKKMVSYLNLESNAKVLELSCGTGRDSQNIANLLDEQGQLFVQDISGAMLKQCKRKLSNVSVPVNYSIGNASYLPFPNHYFDAVYSFGGLNVFDDLKRSLKEMVRVTRRGGRIVVGDESLPEWLYDTEFGKTLINGNPLLKSKVPFASIPCEARDVSVRWIIGGVYYLITFTVGEGEPVGNFDIEIPGKRGGTLRTRYFGQLEGVSEDTKRLVLRAAEESNKSIYRWLDQTLRQAAENDLATGKTKQ